MTIEMTQEQIARILQGIHVPPQPQILVDLQMEQASPNPNIRRIAALIAKDVGLAGTMLKFVNSSFYGLATKISSIEQAVSMLGLNTVINILNGIAIKGEMTDESIIALTRFWDTANDIAMVCSTIAKNAGIPLPEEAYTLGLFHNAGIPLMMKRFPHYLAALEQAYAAQTERVIDLENERFNTNHCVVGYYIGRSWNLPEHICLAIAEHHNTYRIFSCKENHNQKLKTLIAILKLAEHICGNYKIFGNAETDREWDSSEVDILEHLGLTSYDVDDLKESLKGMGINVY